MRPLVPLLALAMLASACGGRLASPSASGTTPAASESPSSPEVLQTLPPTTVPILTPTPAALVSVPRGAPTRFAAAVAPQDLPLGTVAPKGSDVTSEAIARVGLGGVDQVSFAWRRGADPFASLTGFEVWQRFDGERPAWRIVYAFTDRPRSGVLGVRFETGDATGDGIVDALTFEDMGGSGACGTWRVIRGGPGWASETLRRQTCDAELRIVGGGLELREAVFRPGDAHCCPSAYRITTFTWEGKAWVVTERHLQRS